MDCRQNCGACCIALSISSPIPGMPDGKPAGIRCVHLKEDYSCGIYAQRPVVCIDFRAEEGFCGNSRREALGILSRLENKPDLIR